MISASEPIVLPRRVANTQVTRSCSRLHAFFSAAPVRLLKPNEVLFAEGDRKANAYEIESGGLLIHAIGENGTRRIVAIAFPGDFIGLDTGEEHAFEATAYAPCRIRVMPKAALWRSVAEEPILALAVCEALSAELAELRNHLMHISRLSADGRLAHFLQRLISNAESRGTDARHLILPMRRMDIADYLSLSVETVSRGLTKLKSAGVITLSGWRRIRIEDVDALEKIARDGLIDADRSGLSKAA